MSAQSKLTIPDLAAKKAAGERLVMVAVGEAMSAAWAERAGIDIIGIGDSLGMTLHGHENTLAITVDQMIDHCRAVRRGARQTFTLASMPYGSYATPGFGRHQRRSDDQRRRRRSGKAARRQGDVRHHQSRRRCRRTGDEPRGFAAPSRTHAGRVQDAGANGRSCAGDHRQRPRIQEAGAIGLEIEAMPYEVGKAVDEAVDIFTFSIGAGAAGTCQLLNGYDLIGAFDSFKPKFAKRYAQHGRNRDQSLC